MLAPHQNAVKGLIVVVVVPLDEVLASRDWLALVCADIAAE